MAQPRTPADVAADLRSLDEEELVRIVMDDAKNWLAHDGLWFQAVEAAHGVRADRRPENPDAVPRVPARRPPGRALVRVGVHDRELPGLRPRVSDRSPGAPLEHLQAGRPARDRVVACPRRGHERRRRRSRRLEATHDEGEPPGSRRRSPERR
ncbi:hypothetical protein Anae109_1048 [Anaeromyxobacter sp. Fw109-5]|nr:hypothetical protein Anae109_1048 [Anaeromyxobacter sp. Fw109-5]